MALQVPYQDLPFLFFGEEQAMLARMWTAGFDLYAPPRTVAWHLWSRSYRPTFHSCVPQVMHWQPLTAAWSSRSRERHPSWDMVCKVISSTGENSHHTLSAVA